MNFQTNKFFLKKVYKTPENIRDVVAGRPSIIMQPELYVTAAALSSALCIGGILAAASLGLDKAWAWGLAFTCGFALRTAAIRWEIGLPSYRAGD